MIVQAAGGAGGIADSPSAMAFRLSMLVCRAAGMSSSIDANWASMVAISAWMFVLAVASSVVMPSITVCSVLTFAMIRFSIFSRSLLYAIPKWRDHHPGLFDQ